MRGRGRRRLAPFSAKRRALGAPSADATLTTARSPSAAKQTTPPPAVARSNGVRFGSMYSYGWIKKIGEGAFGVVSKGRHLGTGELVAIKTVLEGGEDEELLQEIGLLALCAGNPAVVELREVARCLETSKLCLVMVFVRPSLLDILCRRQRWHWRLGRAFSESDIRRVMQCTCRASSTRTSSPGTCSSASATAGQDLRPRPRQGHGEGAATHAVGGDPLVHGARCFCFGSCHGENRRGKEEVRSIWMKKEGSERAGEEEWRKKEKRKRKEGSMVISRGRKMKM